ncbi:uncharacterized protein DC041_0007457, partial [Schistosoma bovis]
SGVPSDHTTEPSTSQTSTHIPSEVSSQSSEPTTSTTPTHPQTDSSIVTSEFNDCFALGDVYFSIGCMRVFVFVCWCVVCCVFCFGCFGDVKQCGTNTRPTQPPTVT